MSKMADWFVQRLRDLGGRFRRSGAGSEQHVNYQVKVLFVCMGNICRSPTAEGVFARLLAEAGLTEQVFIDSAGTHGYHLGHPPDRRSQAAALQRGIDISGQRSRRLVAEDFERFDYLLAMDKQNLADMLAIGSADHADKAGLLLAYGALSDDLEVPDPYYGGANGFERVLDMIEVSAQGLLTHIRREYGL